MSRRAGCFVSEISVGELVLEAAKVDQKEEKRLQTLQ